MRKLAQQQNNLFAEYPDVMKVTHVMKALGVGRHAVYRLIDTKALASFKVGNAFRVTKTTLQKYVHSQNEKGNKTWYNHLNEDYGCAKKGD